MKYLKLFENFNNVPFKGFSDIFKFDNVKKRNININNENLITIDNGKTVLLKKDSTLLAKVIYDKIDDKISISMIESYARGYGKILMLHLIEEYGYDNIITKVLTKAGQKMMDDLNDLYNFKKQSNFLNRKDLFKSINNQLIITVLDNICEYGIKNTLKAFKNDIIDNKINNIEIETLVDISSWIDDSVQNNHSIDDNIPDYIYDEIEKLKNR